MRCSTLVVGEYLILSEVDWIKQTQDKSFVVTSYGAADVEFQDRTDDAKFDPHTYKFDGWKQG